MKRPRSYPRYLRSRTWRRRRTRVLARDEHGCLACGCLFGLQVHHLTYKRVGRERMNDLVTLCSPCHVNEHLFWELRQRRERLEYWRFLLKHGPEDRLAWGGLVGR